MNHALRPVDIEVLEKIKNQWLSAVSEQDDLPSTPYEMAVVWAEKSVSNQDEANLFAIMDGSGDQVFGLVSLAHAHPRHPDGWLKITNITIAPSLDLRAKETSSYNVFTRRQIIGTIAADLIIWGLDLAEHRNVKQIKIYASTEVTLALLELVVSNIDAEVLKAARLEADTHGNWLVIHRTNC